MTTDITCTTMPTLLIYPFHTATSTATNRCSTPMRIRQMLTISTGIKVNRAVSARFAQKSEIIGVQVQKDIYL